MDSRLRRAWKLLSRPEKSALGGFLLLRILTVIVDLAVIFLLAEVFRRLALQSGESSSTDYSSIGGLQSLSIHALSAVVVGAYVVRMGVVLGITRAMLRYVASVESEAAAMLSQKLFSRGLKGFSDLKPSEIQWTVIQSAEYAITKTITLTFQFLTEALTILAIIVFLLFLRAEWAIIGAIYFLAVAVALQVFLNVSLRRAGARFAKSTRQSGEHLLGLIRAYRDLAVLGAMDRVVNELAKTRRALALANAESTFLKGVPRYYLELFSVIAFAAIAIWLDSSEVLASDLDTVTLFVASAVRLVSSLIPAQVSLAHLKFAGEQSEAALTLFERAEKENNPSPKTASHAADRPNSISDWTLVLEDVDFTYPGASEPLFTGINLRVQPGEMVALVGPSGVGKTTLLDICAGIRNADSGKVTLGSQSPEEVALECRGKLAYVSQKPSFLATTWCENLALQSFEEMGDPSWLEELVDGVGLREWRLSLPDGLETRFGFSVDRLSGGQLQRLAIVRAMYSKPRVVFLDEATSNLDSELEKKVVQFFRHMLPNTASMWVTHRPTVVESADTTVRVRDFIVD